MAKPSPSLSGNEILVALGKAIRTKRKNLNMPQEALALEAGIDRSYLGGIERGEHNVAIINLSKIANSLGIKLSELIAGFEE